MDIFYLEILRLWEVLNLMGGRIATHFHGYQSITDGIDIWIEDTLENRKKIRKIFQDCNLGDFEPLERMPFIPGWTYFHLNNGVRLDFNG